jgi:hypothetical protein
VKFCRRIGEKGEGPRPLIAGFYTETDRSKVLRYGKYLSETEFKDVTVGPDLTKVQREEERDLKEEAERKNEELTEDDRSKNLQWIVVGPKGEKRLIKAVQREREWTRGGRRTSGMRGGRTRQEQRTNTGGFKGTGRGEREKQTGKNGADRGTRRTEVSGEETEMDTDEETPAAATAKKKATKRKERSPATASPPGKR